MSQSVLDSAPSKLGKPNFQIAIIGNPNSGKTTLFNVLTGFSQKVANYPGVTVERVSGPLTLGENRGTLVDIPGTYSLSPRSPDEAIASDTLQGSRPEYPRPDLALVVVNSTNLDRELYLVLQVLEMHIPTVIALSMYDLAQRRGIRIDHKALALHLGVEVVPLAAHRREGIDSLKRAIHRSLDTPPPKPALDWPHEVNEIIDGLVTASGKNGDKPLTRGSAIRLLFDGRPSGSRSVTLSRAPEVRSRVAEAKNRLNAVGGIALEVQLGMKRAVELARQYVERPRDPGASWTSRMDRILLHPFLGPAIMVIIMLAVFQSIFLWAQPLMEAIDSSVGMVSGLIRQAMPDGALQSLLADGLVGGVGAVLIFLPQILILFFFIGILEDSGYMPRAAFLVDRVFKGCGLTGRSLIPLLSSFACAVPGIMATRTIDNRRQRFLTILVAPLMTCSARLPVYAVLIAAFVPAIYLGGIFSLQGLTLAALYALGLVVAAGVSLVLKLTLFKGPMTSFVMELPSYNMPKWSNVFMQMWQQGVAFLARAGTIIMALAIVLWALSYYPHSASVDADYARQIEQATGPDQIAELENMRASDHLASSYLGRTGRMLEPLTMHLGWDWKITMAVIAAFPAREVIISTLGIIYNLGESGADDQGTLVSKLRNARWDHGPRTGEPVYNIAVAASVMVFFALCCQCMATLATIRRETNTWKWPVFAFVYMSVLAVVGSYVVYQVGLVTGFGGVI